MNTHACTHTHTHTHTHARMHTHTHISWDSLVSGMILCPFTASQRYILLLLRNILSAVNIHSYNGGIALQAR